MREVPRRAGRAVPRHGDPIDCRRMARWSRSSACPRDATRRAWSPILADDARGAARSGDDAGVVNPIPLSPQTVRRRRRSNGRSPNSAQCGRSATRGSSRCAVTLRTIGRRGRAASCSIRAHTLLPHRGRRGARGCRRARCMPGSSSLATSDSRRTARRYFFSRSCSATSTAASSGCSKR